MAKIESTDLALVTARVGCLRLGASRLGFYPYDVKGAGDPYPCEYMWREVKPPTTQWTLLNEGVVCGKRPVAAFTDSPDPSEVLENVQFTDQSTPAEDITYWHWDFGDGSTSEEQNPTHAYATDGVYTVTLHVASPKGLAVATGTHTVSVEVVEAHFTWNTNDENDQVSVDATASFSSAGSALDCLWGWGDAIAATGTMQHSGGGAFGPLGKSVTIGGQTYNFVPSPLSVASLGDVYAGANYDAGFDNLTAAINTTDPPDTGANVIGGTFYVPLNTEVTAVANPGANEVDLTAQTAGAAGNSITFSGDAILAPGSLAGGADETTGTGVTTSHNYGSWPLTPTVTLTVTSVTGPTDDASDAVTVGVLGTGSV